MAFFGFREHLSTDILYVSIKAWQWPVVLWVYLNQRNLRHDISHFLDNLIFIRLWCACDRKNCYTDIQTRPEAKTLKRFFGHTSEARFIFRTVWRWHICINWYTIAAPQQKMLYRKTGGAGDISVWSQTPVAPLLFSRIQGVFTSHIQRGFYHDRQH